MLRTREACKALGIHKVTLYRWIRTGLIQVVRLPSGEFRVPQESIDLILTHGRLTAKKPRRRKISPLR